MFAPRLITTMQIWSAIWDTVPSPSKLLAKPCDVWRAVALSFQSCLRDTDLLHAQTNMIAHPELTTNCVPRLIRPH